MVQYKIHLDFCVISVSQLERMVKKIGTQEDSEQLRDNVYVLSRILENQIFVNAHLFSLHKLYSSSSS